MYKQTRFVAILCFVVSLMLFGSVSAAQSDLSVSDVQAVLDETIEREGITGLSLTIYSPILGRVSASAGYANADTQTPLETDDLTYVGSVTKTFVTTIIMQLIEDGSLSLDDTIDQWFPDYPYADKITIEQLLTMTSGTYNFFDESPENPFILVLMQDVTHQWTPDEVIETAASVEPTALPGAMFHYSNTNFIMLGRIIEFTTGNEFQEELHNRILTPLGMESTYLSGYEPVEGNLVPSFVRDSAAMFGSPAPFVSPHEIYVGMEMMAWAAGGLVGTSGDLAQGMYGVFNSGIISDESLSIMTTPKSIHDVGVEYGYGMMIFDTPLGTAYGHTGSLPGYASLTMYVPKYDLSISVITNDESGRPLLPSLLFDGIAPLIIE